ncbi:polycystin-2-like [Branchiostoma lanceolatum]|uniref:polycystin-2-like n=1 Tax=Branchiostoma lanceolatum TaxID=7740 RepID=UPI003456C707
MTSFTNAFNEASRDVFYDKQLWVSALVAAPGFSFTKAQRLSCCLTLLNTMMLASAMWYRADNTTADTRVLSLGFVRFTTEELYISLMTALTVLPVNLMLLQLFRMEAPLSVNTPGMSIRSSKQGYFRRTLFRLAKYVAWVTVFLVSTSSAFFVLLYSMDWGKEKSDSWMKAFILSFMGSSCVVDTLQIFVLAVALAAIFSLPFLAKPPTIQKEDLQLSLWNSTAPKKIYPPAKPDRQSARKKNELSKKSASVLKEFLLLFIFVVLLFYIAQADKDQLAFHETQSLSNNILQEYDAIKTPDQFYAWIEDVLLPTLYPATWYNGRAMRYLDRQFAHNTGSFRLGPPRLTQVRQLSGSVARRSIDGLGWSFFWGNVSGACWRFEVQEILTHPNTFDCRNHHSFDVPLGHDSAVSFFGVLKDNNFIDKYTKSVAIVLNFYNPSLKLFSVVNMIIERSGVGHLVPTASITSFKLFQYESDTDYVDLFIHILFTLVLTVIVFREIKAIKNTGWKYFTSKWNALVCVSLIGTATTISVFIKRYLVASETLGMLTISKGELGFERFIDLQTATYWDACFKHLLGLVVFINTISLLRMVRFSQTIGKLLALPGIMKEELMSFVAVAAVAFMAFISSGFLIFGSEMESYTDLYHTAFALFEMMLGRFFAQDMLDSNPLTGPIFFSTFMICIFILLMNFLMTIICDAISADVDVNHDRELADHMWNSFGAMFGFHSPPKKEDKPGVLKMEELKTNICIIRVKLDEGLDICNSILPSNRQEKHPKNAMVPSFLKYGHCHTSYHITREERKLASIVEENENSTTGMEVAQQPADANVNNFDIDADIIKLEQEYEKEDKLHHENKEHKLLTTVRMQTKEIEDIVSRVNRGTRQTVQKVPRCIQVAAAPREKRNFTIATHHGQKRPTRNMWISDLKLTVQDMAVLLSDDMLTDKHIHAAHMLLRRQYPELGGLQDTAVGASAYGYTRVSGEGLQIHHAGILHWVVSSTIGGHVSVFNSMPSKINVSLERQLCQCYAPLNNMDTDVLTVKVPCVQLQSSRFTCGLFAIAWAVDIAMGTDVTQVRYEESRMRAHLLDCFERGHLSPFPHVRRITSRRPSAEHRIRLAAATLNI